MKQDTDDHAALVGLLNRRHSCRRFLPTPLARDTIEQILAAAARTASWCNAQPWHVHVVSGAPLESLRTAMLARAVAQSPAQPDLDWPREYRGVYQERRRECGWAHYRAVDVDKGDRAGAAQQAIENFRFFNAPHVAILTSDEALGTHGVLDCGGWLSNFMLAATSLGVATIAQAALASWPDVLRKELDIDATRNVVCGVSFGIADPAHAANSFRTTRADVCETVTWVG